MNRKYFGTDGIRDVASEGLLAPDRVRAYGEALGVYLEARSGKARVLIGRDTRASGPEIIEGLALPLLAHGHDVIDGGVLTTPAVQTLCREERFELAIVISASHNPASDNGIKLFGGDGRKLQDESEAALETLIDGILAGNVSKLANRPGMRIADQDAAGRYLRYLRTESFPILSLSGMRIVLDCAHGAASKIAPEALRDLGADLDVRGAAPDGTNINQDAGVFFVQELGPLVRTQNAVLGLALDGDADRVLLVDEKGDVRDGDHMLGVLAHDMRIRGVLPGNRVVTTVMANMGLLAFLRGAGIAAECVPVGDRFVAARMDELGATLGGEQSGHIIFRSGSAWFGDGLYTALRVLEVMRRTGRPLSELARPVEKFPQVLVNVRVAAKRPFEEVAELRDALASAQGSLGDDGRILLRYSGTEPLLRVMVEGRRRDQVESLAYDLADIAARALI